MGKEACKPGMAFAGRCRQRGFGLVDVLVALLLLAVTLLGTAATLVHTQSASQAARLQTRAADLMADLAEDLRPGSDPLTGDAAIAIWRKRVAQDLPVGSADVSATGAIHLQWLDPSTRQSMSVQLPAVMHWSPPS